MPPKAIERIFVIDDALTRREGRIFTDIFADANICYASDVIELLGYLEGGKIPQLLFTDCHVVGDFNWGEQNADIVLGWMDKHLPNTPYPAIIFQSSDLSLSEENAALLRARHSAQKPTIYAVQKSEIYLAASLLAGRTLDKAEETPTTFRQCLRDICGMDIPVSLQDLYKHLAATHMLCPHDVMVMLEHGVIDAPTALHTLRDDALREMDSLYRPELDYDAAPVPLKQLRESEYFFQNSTGPATTGYAAFSQLDVENLLAEHKPPILFLEEYTTSFLPYLDKLAGVVLASPKASGHMQILLESHGIAGALGVNELSSYFNFIKERVPAGQPVTLSGAGHVYPMHISIRQPDQDYAPAWLNHVEQELGGFLSTKDISIPKFKINIDAPTQGRNLRYDTEGIGLARTEHFIMRDEAQLVAFKKAVLLRDDSAFATLREACADDMATLFYPEINDYPIRVRLVDLPPMEVFSDVEREQLETLYGDADMRGVQLATQLPELYEAQIHGIFEGLKKAKQDFINNWDEDFYRQQAKPMPEIMVPTIKTADELCFVKAMTSSIAATHGFGSQDYRFGAMLETKAACADIEAIAKECDFISIGTNDLSAEILSCPRDDFETRNKLMLREGQAKDPFLTLYPQVVDAIDLAISKARRINPDLQVDLCGAHATDVDSLHALRHIHLDHVSLPSAGGALPCTRLALQYDAFERHAGKHARPVNQAIFKNTP